MRYRIGFLITTVDPLRSDGVRELVGGILRAARSIGGVRAHVVVMSSYRLPLPPRTVLKVWRRVPAYVEGLNEGLALLPQDLDLVVKMDDDLRLVDPLWLQETIAGARRHPESILGAKLLRPDGSVQHAGGVILRLYGRLLGAHYGEVIEVDTLLVEIERPCEFVTGAYFVITGPAWRALGPFDPAPGAWEDSEYCFRAREKGREVWYLPHVVLEHRTGQGERAADPASAEAYRVKMLKAEAWFKRRYAGMILPRRRLGP